MKAMRVEKDRIVLNKELTELDRLTRDFVRVLDNLGLRYVVISGYVSILFGRSRNSEDVDIIIEKIDSATFEKLWNVLPFECIITSSREEGFAYLTNGLALRFARKDEFIPNIELKFPKGSLDAWSLTNRLHVDVNGVPLMISPLELQIAYKFFLGSEKDVEDAIYLYRIFKDTLKEEILRAFGRKLNIEKEMKKYLWNSQKSI